MKSYIQILILILLSVSTAQGQDQIKVRKIWDQAPHSAFTDILYVNGHFYCTFREAGSHVAWQGDDNGKIRVIKSENGENWESVILIEEPGIDLRDPKLSMHPDGRMMLTMGGSLYNKGLKELHTRVAFSNDFGESWSRLFKVTGIPAHNWFFRITWHNDIGYVMPNIYPTDPETGNINSEEIKMELYKTLDGINYERISIAPIPDHPCEATIEFNNEELIAYVRSESGEGQGRIARSEPPYVDWKILKTTKRFGGPNLKRLPDGRWIFGSRELGSERKDNTNRTVLYLTDPYEGTLNKVFELPSGGDTSYPGILIKDNKLWVSYYSGHEGKTSIYLAEIPLEEIQ